MATLAELAATIRTSAETAAVAGRTLLDEILPQVEQLGAQVENHPVINTAVRIAGDATLPAGAMPILAEMLDRLAASYRQAPGAPAQEQQAA